MSDPAASVALAAKNIMHRYAGVLALADVSLEIKPGTFTAILGPNGSGKSTLAQILCGVLRPTRGLVIVNDKVQSSSRKRAFVKHGVVLVPEGRRLFGQLTIRENLLLGAYGASCAKAEMSRRLAATLELMPARIKDGPNRSAAMLSGGEQQMLALGRALMAAPQTLIMDEPSLGLAPVLIDQVYAVLGKMNAGGVTVVVIEQIAVHAMQYANSVALLDRGKIAYFGPNTASVVQKELQAGYLGHANR